MLNTMRLDNIQTHTHASKVTKIELKMVEGNPSKWVWELQLKILFLAT